MSLSLNKILPRSWQEQQDPTKINGKIQDLTKISGKMWELGKIVKIYRASKRRERKQNNVPQKQPVFSL